MIKKRAFISYVKEDYSAVHLIKAILEENGISVWLDKEQLIPGTRWKTALEDAIRNGSFFISVHSKNRTVRESTYANEELVVAIDEVRKRPQSKSWLIPVKLDEEDIEDRTIGGGEKYSDLQHCNLASWEDGMRSLLTSLGVSEPKLFVGEPLAEGIPSEVDIIAGSLTYDEMPGAPALFQGMRVSIERGWCARDSGLGKIVAYIETLSPLPLMQRLQKRLGASGFHAISNATHLSMDENVLTHFTYQQPLILRRGEEFPDLATGTMIEVPMDISLDYHLDAYGFVSGDCFKGSFSVRFLSDIPLGPAEKPQRGKFSIQFSTRPLL
ncbi:hypothetical protein JAN5088_00393 [Jannaschia rubra]|uniref:TIR domain-containing protein n=2 Tax=Jannaschia rubra TaxID=282197 RepID=A0A0M6XNF1_9RHOB|nr:hypothetical protein JAN5088_00393 [Jannaschia rubra]SFF75934.1 TIR domain-containing protein [Jannaschia rubra]